MKNIYFKINTLLSCPLVTRIRPSGAAKIPKVLANEWYFPLWSDRLEKTAVPGHCQCHEDYRSCLPADNMANSILHLDSLPCQTCIKMFLANEKLLCTDCLHHIQETCFCKQQVESLSFSGPLSPNAKTDSLSFDITCILLLPYSVTTMRSSWSKQTSSGPSNSPFPEPFCPQAFHDSPCLVIDVLYSTIFTNGHKNLFII